MPWINQAPTVVQSWFGGNETGSAIADVLFGDVNPSARLPLTFPSKIEDCTAHLNWGAESGRVTYGETIFVSAFPRRRLQNCLLKILSLRSATVDTTQTKASPSFILVTGCRSRRSVSLRVSCESRAR